MYYSTPYSTQTIIAALLLLPALFINGCNTAAAPASGPPVESDRRLAWLNQLRQWEPFVARLEQVTALSPADAAPALCASVLQPLSETTIGYFRSACRDDYDLSDMQCNELDQFYQYAIGLKKMYNAALEQLRRPANNENPAAPRWRQTLAAANNEAARFLAAWQAMQHRQSWPDSPRPFSWYLDR